MRDGCPLILVARTPDPYGWTARIETSSGPIALHSTRAPMAEARQQLASFAASTSSPGTIAIIGAGLGFIVEAARERWPDARVVVVEPSRELAHHARTRTPALYDNASGSNGGESGGNATCGNGTSGNGNGGHTSRWPVVQMLGPAYDGAADLWRLFDRPDDREAIVVVHPVLARVLSDEMAAAERMVRRAIGAAQMNALARREHAGRYLLNTLRNLPHIVRGPNPAVLTGLSRNVPAVVVGAGPSLNGAIPALRPLADRALLIASDTAWRPLVSGGVDPPIVAAVDPSEVNGRHLVDVPARQDTWLLAEGAVDPRCVQGLTGRVAMFRIGTHHPWPWLDAIGVQRPLVRVWGSVLTAACDLALAFGCDPIIFVGADLAFTDGRPYCRGTSFEEDWSAWTGIGVSLCRVWENTLSARTIVTTTDVNGRDTQTAPHLIEFRDWLVARSEERRDLTFVNATGAGILHGGRVQQMPLDRALADRQSRGNTLRELLGTHLRASARPELPHGLRRAIEDILSATAGDALLSDWLAFGRPSLARDAIDAALASAREALRDSARPASRTATDATSPVAMQRQPSMHAADRVARLRAFLTGDRTVLDGIARDARIGNPPTPPAHASVGHTSIDSIDDSARLLDPLWTMAALLAEVPGDSLSLLMKAAEVPASCLLPWVPDARAHLVAYEEAIASAVAQRHDASNRLLVEFSNGDRIDDGDMLARLVLIVQQLAYESHGSTIGDALAARFDERVRLRVPAITQRSFPIRIDASMRRAAGTLVRQGAQPGADDLAIEPEFLTERSVARAWSCATLDDRTAIVTPVLDHSLRIDAAGSVEAGARWPCAITGEIPWGREGGALAWHRNARVILLRPRAHAEAVSTTVPFRPFRAALDTDGTPFWCTIDGGVWTWLPGREGRLIADTPTCIGLRIAGDDLVLDPVTRHDGAVMRQRLSYAWRVPRGGGSLERIPSDPAGAQTSAATRAAWTAQTFPFSDVVRLIAADGTSWQLACPAPGCAAWAGASLIVTTLAGAVLLFRGLETRLSCSSRS